MDEKCGSTCYVRVLADLSQEYVKAHAKITAAKTAVANARCKVVITGSSSVTTTSPPSKLCTMSRSMARAKDLDGPAGLGLSLHTAIVPASRRIPVTMVSSLWTYSTKVGQLSVGKIAPLHVGQ